MDGVKGRDQFESISRLQPRDIARFEPCDGQAQALRLVASCTCATVPASPSTARTRRSGSAHGHRYERGAQCGLTWNRSGGVGSESPRRSRLQSLTGRVSRARLRPVSPSLAGGAARDLSSTPHADREASPMMRWRAVIAYCRDRHEKAAVAGLGATAAGPHRANGRGACEARRTDSIAWSGRTDALRVIGRSPARGAPRRWRRSNFGQWLTRCR